MRENPPRRTLDELLALYMLEPTLVDFYVEGRTDRVFLEYLTPGAHVIEIDAVDVSAAVLAEYSLTPNARNRVMGLAAFLDERLAETLGQGIRCIIDADMDRFLERESLQSRFLRVTDFSCIESYYFDAKHLLKYRKIGLHDVGVLGHIDLWEEIQVPVRETFVVRAALASREFGWAWVSPATCCSQVSGRITFDAAEFIRRLVSKNNAWSHRSDLVKEVAELRSKVDGDARHFIQGHDFIEILAWYIRPHVREKQLAHEEVVARMVACCHDATDSLAFPLLRELLEVTGESLN